MPRVSCQALPASWASRVPRCADRGRHLTTPGHTVGTMSFILPVKIKSSKEGNAPAVVTAEFAQLAQPVVVELTSSDTRQAQ